MTGQTPTRNRIVNSHRSPAPESPAGALLDPLSEQVTTVSSRAEWAHQQLSALVTDIGALQHSLSQARVQSQRVFAANRSLGERVRTLGDELTRLRSAYGEQQQLNRELHDIASQLADSHGVLEGELAGQRAENGQLRGAMAELQAELARVGSGGGAGRVTEALAAERAQVEQLREVVRTLEAELDAAQKAAPPAAPARAEGSATELMMLRADAIEKRKKIEHLEQRLASAALERVQTAPLTTQVHHLAPARPPSGASSAAAAAEAARLRSTVQELEAALDEAESEIARLRRAIEARDAALDEADATSPALPTSATELVALQHTVDAQQKEIQRLRAALLAR